MEAVLQASSNPTFSSHRNYLKSWLTTKKRLRLLAERWKFQIQENLTAQSSSEKNLVHVIKEGDNLTSIAKQCGVLVNVIAAANKNVEDVDLLFKGHELKIPSGKTLKGQFEENIFDSTKRCQTSFNILRGQLTAMIFVLRPAHLLPHAKATGYFLVLVPLVAFCIRCILGAFHNKVSADLKYRAVNESDAHHRGSRSMRWKSALRDIREPDVLDSDSSVDSNSVFEDEFEAAPEEGSHAYTKLEHDYQNFLSECGISESGYWRGGSPK